MDDCPRLGIDIGSVSLNLAVLDPDGNLLASRYERTAGQPLPRLLAALERLRDDYPRVVACGTGSGRPLLADLLALPVENEIVAHAWGAVRYHPEARTVIEIGGQDSKLILLEGRAADGHPLIADHAMNEICAAGTGSFLDQQAARLGVEIEEEFGRLALQSEHPAPVAGRCSVFAKSDMIHLQQDGYPREDIIAGLCYALARNYLANLARGRSLQPPFVFQGGVAANKGVVRAFEDLLGLEPGELIIPEHFRVAGAIGAALLAGTGFGEGVELAALVARLADHLHHPPKPATPLPRLKPKPLEPPREKTPAPTRRLFLGVDVGSVSTNFALLDEDGEVRGELYLYTEGDPVGVVRRGLGELGRGLGQGTEVAAVGVTGSGRHLIGDFVGADLVVNEITAQARAATAIDPAADTVFEIGGQDSKFIRLEGGAVVDFEMNKVCAAGTGAFLAEQATRLGINVEEEFSSLAFSSEAPADLGSRCTVFMESDLIHHQQQGTPKADLVAGLAYAIARNYLEKVVGHRPIGRRILFQGGVASNASVVAAFESLLGKTLTVPPHNRTTGAIGAALLARDAAPARSAFHGFDLAERTYDTETFVCSACPNRCEIKKVVIDGQATAFYGSICGKYDLKTTEAVEPDLFAERERKLLEGWLPEGPAPDAPAIGIPRILLFHELFPEWCAFFQALGYRVVLSQPTNRHIIRRGMSHVVAETCFPVKIAYGHTLDLMEKGVRRVFLPAVVEVPRADSHRKHYTCPFIHAISSFIRSAFPDLEVLRPVIDSPGRRTTWARAMRRLGRELGHGLGEVARALRAARAAQARFERWRRRRGREVLARLPEGLPTVVVFGRPYNACDAVLNMQLARKLRQRGALPVPLDLLPLGEMELEAAWDDVVWKAGREFVAAADLVRSDPRLHPLFVTNFGCGPDGFLLSILEERFAGQPFLSLELDEHFADAGLVTRLEAFLHEVRTGRGERPPAPRAPDVVFRRRDRLSGRVVYIPNPSIHSLAAKAAVEAIGLEARLLPPPDRHTEELGRMATMSRGCIPLIFFAGDALRMTEQPGFEPGRSALLCVASDEPCKVSQFPRAIRRVLDRAGAGEVELVAPRLSLEHADTFEVLGPRFERVFWRTLVALDLLTQKLHLVRPRAVNPQEAERVFGEHAEQIASEAAGRRFLQAVGEALAALEAVAMRADGPRPRIGLIGEHFAQSNPYVNNDLVRHIEALGGEVWFSPYFTDYLRLQARVYSRMMVKARRPVAALAAWLRRLVQERDYERLEDLFVGHLDGTREPTLEGVFTLASPYLDPRMLPHVVLGTGKAADFVARGFAGLVNVLPLACLTATSVASHFPMLRAANGSIPILSLTYDCLKATNQMTRLQAFMHQVRARAGC